MAIPNPPDNFRITSFTGTTIDVAWDDTNLGTSQYRLAWLFIEEDPFAVPWRLAGETVTGAEAFRYTNLEAGRHYCLGIRAFDPAIPSDESTLVTIDTTTAQLGRARPVTVIDPGNWLLWPNQPPDVVFLQRPDPEQPITDPALMPINTSLPQPDRPILFESEGVVRVQITAVSPQPDGYWVFGIGTDPTPEYSETRDPTILEYTLSQNNGTGPPYDPQVVDGEWFCIRAIFGEEVSGNDDETGSANCNTFQAAPPTTAPPTPAGFSFTTPNAFTHRANADIQGALGFEIEISTDGPGGPWTVFGASPQQLVQGDLPFDFSSNPEEQKWCRMRAFNDDGT